MLGYSVPGDLMENSSFHDTWLYKKIMYKNTLGEMGLGTIALCTLSSNISAPKQ